MEEDKENLMENKSNVPQYDPIPPKEGTNDTYTKQQPVAVTPALPPMVAPPQPKDYIIHSILIILCCFWPLGAIAFYKAYQARRFYSDGLYAEAEAASKDAGQFTKYGCIIGCLIQGLTWGIIVITYGALGITFGVLYAVGVFDNTTTTTTNTM